MTPSSRPGPEYLSLQSALAGRYSLDRELGRGGMGIVFLARDVSLDRPVAIKLLPPSLAAQRSVRERFLREAHISAQLSHPNIIPIHAVEERGHLVYFVMSYVDGESLGERVRRAGPLDANTAVRVLREVAWALAYAHSRGVVHRDVKPDNILLEKGSGRALIADFGIARVADQGSLTAQGELLGTVHYMAPEQALGQAVDNRTDLYALGVTAYFALTGTLPYDAPNLPAAIAHANDPPPRVANARPGLPRALVEVVDRCLVKDPAGRFSRGEDVVTALDEALPTRPPVPPEVRAFMRRATSGAPQLWVIASIAVLSAMQIPDAFVHIAPVLGLFGLSIVTDLIMSARGVLRAGLGFEDLRAAIYADIRAEREESDRLLSLGSTTLERRGRGMKRWGLGAGVAGVVLLFLSTGLLAPVSDPLNLLELLVIIGGILGFYLIPVGTIVFAAGSLVSSRAARARLESRVLGFRQRLGFAGALGRSLFLLAKAGLRAAAPRAPPDGERTEVLLARAIHSLFARLPGELQRRFEPVPSIARRLEGDVAVLRAREARLSGVTAELGPADQSAPATARAQLERGRARVRDRIAAAVAAMENLRLDLIRLSVGVPADTDLTADLERARAISEAVSAELAGREAVLQASSKM